MQTCTHCPYPDRCSSQDRCIVFKIGGEGYELPAPVPHPVMTSSGIGTTAKTAIKKKVSKNVRKKIH